MNDIFTSLLDDTNPDNLVYDTPIDDPNSECYQCEAGMCSICRGDMYDYIQHESSFYDF